MILLDFNPLASLFSQQGPVFQSIISLTTSTHHYANTPMRYTAIFHGCKNVNFQMKKYNDFLIFAQTIDCGYTLEPPH